MSNTAVVKVYGSSRMQELLAMVPVHDEGPAQPDEALIDFASAQIRRRLPAEKLRGSHFRVERRYAPAQPSPRPALQPDRMNIDTISIAEQGEHPVMQARSPTGERHETQNGAL